MTSKDITLCGHGSGTPSTKNMKDYCASRYDQKASNGKRKQVVAVRRFKGLTYENRQAFHDAYKTLLGRNQYSQALRQYVYKSYHGVYYSDCSSSGCYTLREIGLDCQDLNTAGIYNSNQFQNVPVIISEGQIVNPEILEVGDALLFVGNDPSRPLQIGHVEYVYEINGGNELTDADICKSIANVAVTAKKLNWPYGDDHDNPPCPPIACDRGIFRALWDLDPKFRDQKPGGETVYTADAYLLKHGFEKNTDQNKIKPNSIIFMKWTGSKSFDWRDHMFFCVSYNNATKRCTKYDFGSNDRIRAGGYFVNVPFNEWSDKKFYASYNLKGGSVPANYLDVTPVAIKNGTKSAWCYTATEILKARGYKGVMDKSTGKRKELVPNFEWSIGDMCAMAECKLARGISGYKDMLMDGGAGNITMEDWKILFGGGFPFRLKEVPTLEKKGLTVLMIQEKLKARGFVGKDGKPLVLDRTYGENTEFAFREYQKKRGGSVDGIVTVKWLKDLFGI